MTGRHGARAALLIASVIGGASCFEAPAADRASSSSQAIIGGTTDTTDTSVVAVVQASVGGVCSGTLVSPTLVLTAAHCVSGIPASQLQVLVGPDITAPTQTVAVTAAVPYPDYDSEGDGIPGGVDLGFVTLAEPLSLTPVPVRTDTTDAELTGATVTVVGFGENDGDDNTGAGTRRSVSLLVSTVCSRTIQAGGEDANACFGDSGGAVLLDGALVAVISGGAGCYAPTTFTRTDAHADWIQAVMAGGSAAMCPSTCTTPDPSCTAATETRAAEEDAGADDAAPSPPPRGYAVGGGGCSATPRRAGDASPWALLYAAVWSLRRRRRR